MKLLAIIISKIAIFIGNLFGKGSDFPGRLALKIDKNIMRKIVYPDIRIIVSGSSGKGSTAKIIYESFKKSGLKVSFNTSGANMVGGILSSIIKDCTMSAKLKCDVLLLEMDERNVKFVYDSIKPTHLIVPNLTKDQPPRQHDPEFVFNDLFKGLTKQTTIITNMDDPFLRKIELEFDNDIIYYSLDKNNYSYNKQLFENLVIYHCPKCGELLDYSYYNIETLGKYACKKCDFRYNEPKVLGKNLDLEKGFVYVGDKKLQIGGDVLFNAYNTLAAYTLLSNLALQSEASNLINSVNKFKPSYFIANAKKVYALNCKAENASTYNQVVYKAYTIQGLKDYVIGWKEISRRYVHFDLSWLYDVEFELLNDENLNKIFACGIDAENIKNRLVIAGIDASKIITSETLDGIKDKIVDSEANNICGILNFDYMKPFFNLFGEGENV